METLSYPIAPTASGTSAGVIVGAVLGAAGGLAVLVTFVFVRRRARNKNKNRTPPLPARTDDNDTVGKEVYKAMYEMDTRFPKAEVGEANGYFELPVFTREGESRSEAAVELDQHTGIGELPADTVRRTR